MVVPIIQLILSSSAGSSPNLPVASGSPATALHVASEIGRAEVGECLLRDLHPDRRLRQLGSLMECDPGGTGLEC